MCRSRRGSGPSLENSNLLDLQSKITENMPQTRFSGSGHVHNYIVHVCIAFNVFNRYWKNLQVKFLSHSGQQLIRGKWVFSQISLMLWLLFNMCLVNFEDKKKFDWRMIETAVMTWYLFEFKNFISLSFSPLVKHFYYYNSKFFILGTDICDTVVIQSTCDTVPHLNTIMLITNNIIWYPFYHPWVNLDFHLPWINLDCFQIW